MHLWAYSKGATKITTEMKVYLPTGCRVTCTYTGQLLEVTLEKNEKHYSAKIVSYPQFRPQGKSLTVTITECFSVSTTRVSTPSWASGNTAITIISGVNTIQIYVAAILQENTECKPRAGYTSNGCTSHCRLTSTSQADLTHNRPKERRLVPASRVLLLMPKA